MQINIYTYKKYDIYENQYTIEKDMNVFVGQTYNRFLGSRSHLLNTKKYADIY